MSHISRTHKVTREEIVQTYPNIKLCTEYYSKMQSEKMSATLKKQWLNADYAAKKKELAKQRFIEMNKDDVYRAKVSKKSSKRLSKTLKEQWKNPEYRQQRSDFTKQQHAQPDSKLQQSIMKNAGKKRYKYKELSLRSTWEVQLAKHLDENNIEYQYEAFSILMSNNKRYYPDFYIPQSNMILEVKPLTLTLKEENLFKKENAESQGYIFKYVTENELKDLKNLNLNIM